MSGRGSTLCEIFFLNISDGKDNARSLPVEPNVNLGVNAHIWVKSRIVNGLGGCRAAEAESRTLDVVAGVRHIYMKTGFVW